MPTHYYVDPGGGSDVTGDGSIGTPWASVQHALDTIQRDTVNGDQINVKAGAPDVLAASLSLATYGTPTGAAPLVIRGYSNTAGDGGVGTLDRGGGNTPIVNGGSYLHFVDLRLTNTSGTRGLVLGNHCSVQRCTIDTILGTGSASYGVEGNTGANITVIGCRFSNIHRQAIRVWQGVILGNVFECGADAYRWSGVYVVNGPAAVVGNLFTIHQADSVGIRTENGTGVLIANNAIYNTAAATARGIQVGEPNPYTVSVLNNIVCGYSGVGGTGLFLDGMPPAVVGHNAIYNCSTPTSYTKDPIMDWGNNITLDADPFVDAANGDFRLTDAAQAVLRSAGWPTGYLGMDAAIDPHITIGALQYGPTPTGGGGGSGAIRRVARILGG